MTEFVINDRILRQEAESLAQEILASYPDADEARDAVHMTCDGHAWVIYTHKALMLCAHCDTSDGEQWLEDCDSLSVKGDTLSQIACRIAFATLYCATSEALETLIDGRESAE